MQTAHMLHNYVLIHLKLLLWYNSKRHTTMWLNISFICASKDNIVANKFRNVRKSPFEWKLFGAWIKWVIVSRCDKNNIPSSYRKYLSITKNDTRIWMRREGNDLKISISTEMQNQLKHLLKATLCIALSFKHSHG